MCKIGSLLRALGIMRQTELTIPHPEETPRTHGNVLNQWLADWEVPGQPDDFWHVVVTVKVDDTIPVPAWTLDKVVSVRHDWLVPGVLAHEMAHVSWSLLSDQQRKDFNAAYIRLVTDDKLLNFVYSQKAYMKATWGQNNNLEGHADTFRYCGNLMPQELKRFYPRLIK